MKRTFCFHLLLAVSQVCARTLPNIQYDSTATDSMQSFNNTTISVENADQKGNPFVTFDLSLDEIPPMYQRYILGDDFLTFDLDPDEIPSMYRDNSTLVRRGWKTEVAFGVVGATVAATGLAADGPENAIYRNRHWFIEKRYDLIWTHAAQTMETISGFQVSMKYAQYALAGGAVGFVGSMSSAFLGDWAMGRVAQTVIAGSSPEPETGKRLRRRADSHAKKGLVEYYKKDSKNHDEFGSSTDICWPTSTGEFDTQFLRAWPTGSSWRVTCKAYRDYGFEDQFEIAQEWVLGMANRQKTQGTFTVYNRYTGTAHMRCSVAMTNYIWNKRKCPLALPGDEDGPVCRGCPTH